MDYPHLYIKSGAASFDVEEIRVNGEDLTRWVRAVSFSASVDELTTVYLTFHAEVEVDGPIGELIAVHPGCRFDPDDWSWEVDPRCGLLHPADITVKDSYPLAGSRS